MRGKDNASNSLTRKLKRQATDAEMALWPALRNRGLNGFKFVRQAPIGKYVADFLCRERKLIVEADGSQHFDNARDDVRDAWLLSEGYAVLRIGNASIIGHRERVLETIVAALEERLDVQDSAELKFKVLMRG